MREILTSEELDMLLQSDSGRPGDRRFRRLDISLPAELVAGDRRASLEVTDLGLGGLRAKLPAALVPPDIRLRVQLPGGSVEVTARLRWLDDDGGVGLSFVGLDPDQVFTLTRYLGIDA